MFFVFVGGAKLFVLCSSRLCNKVFGDAVRWGVPKILSHGSWCCEFNMHLHKNATPLRHKYWECALVVFGALPYFQMSVTNMIAGWMGNSQNAAFWFLETNHGLVNVEKLSRRVSGLQYSAIDFYLAASSGLGFEKPWNFSKNNGNYKLTRSCESRQNHVCIGVLSLTDAVAR